MDQVPQENKRVGKGEVVGQIVDSAESKVIAGVIVTSSDVAEALDGIADGGGVVAEGIADGGGAVAEGIVEAAGAAAESAGGFIDVIGDLISGIFD